MRKILELISQRNRRLYGDFYYDDAYYYATDGTVAVRYKRSRGKPFLNAAELPDNMSSIIAGLFDWKTEYLCSVNRFDIRIVDMLSILINFEDAKPLQLYSLLGKAISHENIKLLAQIMVDIRATAKFYDVYSRHFYIRCKYMEIAIMPAKPGDNETVISLGDMETFKKD